MAVIKVIELVGNSTEGWEDAARNAFYGAAKSLHGIQGIEVLNWTAKVSEREIVEYRATVKVAFLVD